MAITKKTTEVTEKKATEENLKIPKKKTISPFKEQDLFEKEIKSFINKYKSTLQNQANRISDFFEMSCFNHIVDFYENNDYTITIENLQNKKYRYKCSPSGVQSNFSHFNVSKEFEDKIYEFEIQHNLSVQSSHTTELFTTPDICIINKGSFKETTEYYETKRRFCYVENNDLMTFCEVKHFNPFPELIFNFIGILNELQKDILTNNPEIKFPIHIAPSLMISGKPNKQTEKIKLELENRYCINIIFDMFNSGMQTFSKSKNGKLKTTGKMSSS